MKKSTCKKLLRVGLLCLAMIFVLGGVLSFAETTTTSDLTVVDEVFAVFDKVGDWLTQALPDMVSVFYNSTTGLTFFGVMCLVSLGLSVIFLVIGIIQSALKFRA